jgi:glycerate 2-kinase
MTRALEEVLDGRIAGGVVVEKEGYTTQTKHLLIVHGGHRIPNSDSVKAAEEVLRVLNKVGKDDLLLVCVSGGWTALTSKPPRGISLEDHIAMHRLLMNSGMTVEQMNIVRNHLSQLGRGKVPMFAKGATTIGLIAVDEVEGKPWGPTVPDSSKFSDAVRVLVDFDFLIADNIRLCESAQKIASKMGINAFILSTSLRGEAKHVGAVVASIANEIANFNRPFRCPCLLIVGGETTVTIVGKSGEGGRNQELALSAAQHISEGSRIVIASIATGGTDGPTDTAGAIVDGTLVPRARRLGIDITRELNEHNSSFVFKQTGDAVYASDTGTNLMDLILVYVE